MSVWCKALMCTAQWTLSTSVIQNQSVTFVQAKSRCFFWDPYKKNINKMWAPCRSFQCWTWWLVEFNTLSQFMVCNCWDSTWFIFCCYSCYALFLCICVVFVLCCLGLYVQYSLVLQQGYILEYLVVNRIVVWVLFKWFKLR